VRAVIRWRLAGALAIAGALAAAACDDAAPAAPAFDPSLPDCPVPVAPTLSRIHGGATVAWGAPAAPADIELGVSAGAGGPAPASWWSAAAHTFERVDAPTPVTLFARVAPGACAPRRVFEQTYEVAPAYEPPAGAPGSTAIPMDDPRILGWAVSWVEPPVYGEGVDAEWRTPGRAMGPAKGTTHGVVALGEGGVITVIVDPPAADGPGPDLAVFENAFSDDFLELAFVEVSSDGLTFERFDSAYLGAEPLGAYGTQPTEQIGGLAGKYRRGFGTPFDLALLRHRPAVLDGHVDLDAIAYVRIVDIVGDGRETDSFGNPIYDPYPTVGSAGFDLDAVAVLNTAR